MYKESVEYINNIGDKLLTAICLNNLGAVASDLGSYREAEELCKESLDIKQKLGNNVGIASSLNILGGISIGLSKYEMAQEHLSKALRVAFDIDRLSLCFEILKNISRLFYEIGKSELSLPILVLIIDSHDSSHFIKNEALEFVQSVREQLSENKSEKEIEKLEAKGRRIDLDEMVGEVLKQLK